MQYGSKDTITKTYRAIQGGTHADITDVNAKSKYKIQISKHFEMKHDFLTQYNAAVSLVIVQCAHL